LNHKPDPESDPELELNLTLLDGETISPDRTIDSNGKDNINRIIKEIKERFSHVQYIFTSAITKKGVSELEESLIPGMTVTFLGSSGVGKSSLINQLAQTDLARTKTIRESDSRGRHTTTHKEMFLLKNKSILIDNPGMREVGLWGDEDDINQNFEDINCYTEQCRFNDCTHKCEPGI
jgi:ribosome biogenesis GTPase